MLKKIIKYHLKPRTETYYFFKLFPKSSSFAFLSALLIESSIARQFYLIPLMTVFYDA